MEEVPSPYGVASEPKCNLCFYPLPSFSCLSAIFSFLAGDTNAKAEADVECLFASKFQGWFRVNISVVDTWSWDGTKDNIGVVRATIVSVILNLAAQFFLASFKN